jgi:hypothetical protein
MNVAIEKNIADGKEAFEDLHLLADARLFPLIGRAYHHFSEVASSSHQKSLLSDMPVLQKFLNENLKNLLEEFFLKIGDNLLWSLLKDERNLELKHWEKILSILPDVLQIMACFKFRGHINIEILPKGISIKGEIINGQSIKDHRVLIYRSFRKLLAKQTLVTFDVKEQKNSFETELLLFADISHNQNEVRAYEFLGTFQEQESLLIAFSPLIKNYKISLKDLESFGQHLIIQINSKLEVVRYEILPDNFKQLFASSEIIHFHFLFRPISLIIGAKGKSLPHYTGGGTGCGQVGVSKEVVKFFDLFSLLSL